MRSGLGNVSDTGNSLVDACIRRAPPPRESNAHCDLDYLNLSASRIVGKLIACIDAIAGGYQTVLLHRQSDVAEPASPPPARDAIEGKRAGRCFYSRGNNTADSPVMHAVAAKQRATSRLTRIVSRYRAISGISCDHVGSDSLSTCRCDRQCNPPVVPKKPEV